MTTKRLLFVFIDGLGLGPADPLINPLTQPGLAVLGRVLDIPASGVFQDNALAMKAIDACLGVDGLPQSGTGQTTLLSGENASRLLGRHLNGFPNRQLREVLSRRSIFAQLARRGIVGDFANAFTPEFFIRLGRSRLSATTWAALAGGRPLPTLHDLVQRRAVYQDFTNLHLRLRGYDVPLRKASEAGVILAEMAASRQFTLYEYFLTDLAGHDGDMPFAALIIRLLDRFLASMLAALDLTATTVLLTSDHGNIEDVTHKPHTTNPVPLMAWGPGAGALVESIASITDVTPAIVRFLAEA